MNDPFLIGLICTIVGIGCGVLLAYSFIDPWYERLLDEYIEKTELKCLQTVRDNYTKEQATRKLLLRELGEALDVDVVELPSFGYVSLKNAEDNKIA